MNFYELLGYYYSRPDTTILYQSMLQKWAFKKKKSVVISRYIFNYVSEGEWKTITL